MLPRGTATEILRCHQNARAFVTSFVQNKASILLPIRGEPPVVKQELAKAGTFNPLQKLLGNDLVGVHVHPVQRSHATAMCAKWFHILLHAYHPERSRFSGVAKDLSRHCSRRKK